MRTTNLAVIMVALLGCANAPAQTITATSADDAWTAKRIVDPFHNDTRCVVESPKVAFNDGYQDTKVFLRVDDRSFYVMTESNLDLRQGDVGVQVDGGALIKPDAAFLDQHLQFESQIAVVVGQFRRGLTADVHLRFWPTWPSKGLKTVRFSLIGFTRTFARLPGC
jgi:hypothetical protein